MLTAPAGTVLLQSLCVVSGLVFWLRHPLLPPLSWVELLFFPSPKVL